MDTRIGREGAQKRAQIVAGMFGCSGDEMVEGLRQTIRAEYAVGMARSRESADAAREVVAFSMLSDVQEVIAQGRVEDARQMLNRVKWILGAEQAIAVAAVAWRAEVDARKAKAAEKAAQVRVRGEWVSDGVVVTRRRDGEKVGEAVEREWRGRIGLNDERLRRIEPGRFDAEASELGFPVGRWPDGMAILMADGSVETLDSACGAEHDAEGDLRWVDYRSARLMVRVYND